MAERLNEFNQWRADNDRLVLASYRFAVEGTPDYDEFTLEIVEKRCIEKFGEHRGKVYFLGLISTFPDRRPDLFPEAFE